jgi:hypothetical protein
MISVQNRRQLLNGSKQFFIIWCIIALVTSCAAGKKSGGKKSEKDKNAIPTEIVDINKQIEATKDTTPVEAPKVLVDTIIKTEVIEKEANPIAQPSKDQYRIVVILPFILDQIPLSGVYVNDTTQQLLPESRQAMDFYLGCKLAKEETAHYDKKLNVYFLDNNNTKEGLDSLLKNNVLLQKADFIIAPFEDSQVKSVAEYGKNKQKTVLSPIVNDMHLTADNPFYYMANPTLYTQYQYLMQEINTANPDTKIEVIYSSTDTLSENISLLKNIVAQAPKAPNPQREAPNPQRGLDEDSSVSNPQEGLDGDLSVDIVYNNWAAAENIAQNLYTADTLSNRIILIYSDNVNYIKTVINKLAVVKNPLTVYTNSTPYLVPALITAKGFKHKVFCAYPYNIDNPQAKIFKQKYTDVFITEPTELSYLGYDMMKFLFNKIDKNEPLFEHTDKPYKEYLQQDFNFVPKLNAKGEVEYFENLNMGVYKYGTASVNTAGVIDKEK